MSVTCDDILHRLERLADSGAGVLACAVRDAIACNVPLEQIAQRANMPLEDILAVFDR
ncbi:hypothetical protein ACFQZ4_45790 [Catellatospora coxensis]|uniref:Uncharacterized protein n=1 Tax=Catellatospora coxensis TaxID=310354 RepID=A0A8J3KUZ9_9ACTN|nr:hypothetical protein [Catellatospora coxensis]GIG05714.1 hypothetical protein Cco03nite_24140 [Catellatospora coxensis]